jgi:CoA:oxalate CoA-transferase
MSQESDTTSQSHKSGILSGLNIIECGEGISAAFAAKMMADLGANVIKVEPPRGDLTRSRGPFAKDQFDPEKSGLFLYLNSNKRGITLDLTRPEGLPLFGKLLARADLLVHNVHPRNRMAWGLDSRLLSQKFPNLMVVGISPFGDTGPYKDWKAFSLTVENAGGMAYLAPIASQFPDLPPLKSFGQQAEYQAGLHACYAALGAYWGRMNGERPMPVEVSAQECLAAILELNLVHYTYSGREASRLGQRVIGPWLLAECSDGVIFVACAEEPQWQRMVELMGDPAWAHEELFKDRLARGANADALNLFLKEWISSWKKRDLFHAGQARRVPFATVNTMKDILEDEQLNFRNYFVDIDYPGIGRLRIPGAVARYGVGTGSIRSLAPRLGQHNENIFIEELGLSRDEFESLRKASLI